VFVTLTFVTLILDAFTWFVFVVASSILTTAPSKVTAGVAVVVKPV
jgi:hypothetical protein